MLVLVADLKGEGEWREHCRYEAQAHIPAERPQVLGLSGPDVPRPGYAASSLGRQAWEHGGCQRAGLKAADWLGVTTLEPSLQARSGADLSDPEVRVGDIVVSKAVMGSGTSHKFKKIKGKCILVKKSEISSSPTSSQKPQQAPATHISVPKPSIGKENGVPWGGSGNCSGVEWVLWGGALQRLYRTTKMGK